MAARPERVAISPLGVTCKGGLGKNYAQEVLWLRVGATKSPTRAHIADVIALVPRPAFAAHVFACRAGIFKSKLARASTLYSMASHPPSHK